jgi:FtsP/CotA-like multicopper oxidase with cupredoxin domain
MYHPHADEMVQMAMGMMGFWVTHPKGKHPLIDEVQRDFCFLLNAYDIDPWQLHAQDHDDARLQPVELEQPHLPGHRPAGVRLNDKVRIRIGNLTMTNHPIHLHGHEFHRHRHRWRPTPKSTRRYESHRRTLRWARCARLSSWPTKRATGPSTATRATTR